MNFKKSILKEMKVEEVKMQAEKLTKEQVTLRLHPDVLAQLDMAREKRLWNRSQFIEWAIIKALEGEK